MDPVSAIGLVAGIIQLVELSTKVTKRLVDFSSAALQDDMPQAFKQIKTALPLIVADLQRIQADGSYAATQDQAALHSVVQGCLSETQELDMILEKALPSAEDSSWERRKKALISLKYDKKIDKIAAAMNSYIGILTLHQVVDLSHNFKLENVPSYQESYWLVPYDKNPSFVGRDHIFKEIESALTVEEGVQPKTALYGLGGIGKSQVALEYCYRKKKKDPRCSIFWCNAATVARFEESLNRMASQCGLISNEQATDSFAVSSDVAFDAASPAKPIMVQEMGVADGLELAKKRLPNDTPEELLVELLEVLEFIPLAITQASAFMAKRRKTVRPYLDLYRKSDVTKMRLLSYEFSDHARPGSSMESVAKTWMISFEAIRESNPRAAELLCLMTFFQHQGVPAFLLQGEEEDEFDFQDAVAALKAFSFVDSNEEDTMFSTHRLVQLATRCWLDQEVPSETERWAFAALNSVATHFPRPTSHPDARYFALGESLLPHEELILQKQFKMPSKEVELARARLLNSSGRYLHWKGSYDEARSRFQESMQINMRLLGERHIDTMTSTGLYGWSLAIIGHNPEAVPMLERLVQLRTEVLGKDDPQTIDALSDFAHAIVAAGDLQKSEAMQREAVARSERILGRRHGNTIDCMAFLAQVLHQQGKQAEATALQREIFTVTLEVLGPKHINALMAEGNLASMLSNDRETYSEAYDIFKRNIQNKGEVYGLDHRETVALLATSFLLVLAVPSSANTDTSEALFSRGITTRKELWKPKVGTPWQIILSQVLTIPKGGVKNLKPNVPIYDVDLFENSKQTFDALHKAGKYVICYFSAGSWENWRDDRNSFQKKDLGKTLSGWPDEKYVNINSPSVRTIMAKRIKLAADKGCDAIDPDNLDGYQADNGLGLTEADTISYVKFLSKEAAKYRMTTGMKNGGSITKQVLPYVGFCINESCIQYSECDLYAPYIKAGKPVFNIEYPAGAPNVKAADKRRICSVTGAAKGSNGFSKVIKKMNLDTWVAYC
ncbi:hypothetical protein BHE90_000330 [Fusarium euwallaceae]|uniref:alpha-galactosidase n=1 Tax=Fusarium euwallaceae TaxID=1147111 RepID=A0A430MAX2_9HYPO|nr:hypothetical protein BHE90_000330 [Fusarium euwallaceae]